MRSDSLFVPKTSIHISISFMELELQRVTTTFHAMIVYCLGVTFAEADVDAFLWMSCYKKCKTFLDLSSHQHQHPNWHDMDIMTDITYFRYKFMLWHSSHSRRLRLKTIYSFCSIFELGFCDNDQFNGRILLNIFHYYR